MNIKSGKFICFVTVMFFMVTGIFSVYYLNSKEKEPIKIGLVTTLTGPASTAGILTRNGALLAIEQCNELGGINGHHIKVIIRDDKGDPEEAMRVDAELIDKGVVAFLAHYLSSVSVKVVPLMKKHNILLLSLGASTSDLYGLNDNFVRIYPANNDRIPLVARETYDRLNVRKVAVVYDLNNAAYTESVLAIYRDEFEKKGGQVIKIFPFNSQKPFDAPGIAKDLIASEANGVFIITDALHGALICQHVRKLNASIPIAAAAWASGVPDFITYGGNAVEGVISVVESNLASTNPTYVTFKKAYNERFGHTPTLHAQNAYDAASILLDVLKKTTDPQKITKELLQQSIFQGVDGRIRIDKNGEASRLVYVMQIQNGRMEVLDTLKYNSSDK